jgi:hypothetical protein
MNRSRLGALMLLVPAVLMAALDAAAQTVLAVAVMYETQESVNCNPGPSQDPACADGAKGFGVRIANATLVGGVPPLPGGISGGINGRLVAEASSILSKVDWTGPAHGRFTAADGTTVVFSGQLDLSLALLGQPPLPLAPISGKWTTVRSALKAGGTFAGVFLIPFDQGCPSAFCYLELDGAGQPTGNVTSLLPSEYASTPSGPVPLVKLVFFMFVR